MKYNDAQLKDMATQFVEAEKENDFRCLQLITVLQMFTGLSHPEIRGRIIQLSNLKTEN